MCLHPKLARFQEASSSLRARWLMRKVVILLNYSLVKKSKRVMQNDAELGFFVFVVEACLYQNIQWYSILLIKRKKRNQNAVFIKKGHLTINEKGTDQDAALAVSNHTSTKERSCKLQVSQVIIISFNVWQKVQFAYFSSHFARQHSNIGILYNSQ